MFNDVFWFMYLVGLADKMSGESVVVFAFVLIVTFIGYLAVCAESNKEFKEIFSPVKWWVGLFVLYSLLVALFPEKEALYAGAGWYVAEETEVTDTMLDLKRLIDQRIAEGLEEDAEKTTE